jgi:hypothetical protein
MGNTRWRLSRSIESLVMWTLLWKWNTARCSGRRRRHCLLVYIYIPAPGFFFDELGNGDCDVCFFYYFLFFASLFFYLWVWGGIINDICFAGSLRFNRSIQPNMYIYDDDQSFSCGSGSSSIWYNQHQSTVISFYFLNLFNTPRLG